MTQEAVLAERAAIDAEIEGKTIVDYINRNADRYGDQAALHFKDNGEWKSLTWKEYRQVIHDAAAGLQDLGVGEGEFVAIMAGNRPEHVISDYAAIHAGATAVTIYSTLAANQIQYIADNCKATVAILEDLEFMKRWDERLRLVFFRSLHVLTPEKFHPLSTVWARRFGACATTAKSNGAAISFTSRRCWPKSRLDSSRSRTRNGRFVIVFICSVRSINALKRSYQLKAGVDLTSKKCKPCARSNM